MNIALLRQPVSSIQAQWLVLGIFEDDPEAPPAPCAERPWKRSFLA